MPSFSSTRSLMRSTLSSGSISISIYTQNTEQSESKILMLCTHAKQHTSSLPCQSESVLGNISNFFMQERNRRVNKYTLIEAAN